MEQTDREIILYMAHDQDWHLPNQILKKTGLKGRNPEKPMTINNIIKRCHFLVDNGFLKIPDPKNDSVVYKMVRRKDGIFCIKNDIDTFETLVTEFIGTPETQAFFYSIYCQNMINSELVEEIKTEWDYPKDIDIKNGGRVRPKYKGLEKIDERFVEFDKDYVLSVLSDEQVLELLRLSPSALRTLISTEYKKEGILGSFKADEKFETSNLNEILILNMLLDLRKFGNLKKGTEIISDTQMKITLQIRTGTKIINLLGKPEPNFVRVHHGRTMEEIRKLRSELKEKNTEYYKLSFGTGWY